MEGNGEKTFIPTTLKEASALCICNSVKKGHDLLLLSLPWSLIYFLLGAFKEKIFWTGEDLQEKYFTIFAYEFFINLEEANTLSEEFRDDLILGQKRFLRNRARVTFQRQSSVVSIVKYDNAESENIKIEICYKCKRDLLKYLEHYDEGKHFTVLKEQFGPVARSCIRLFLYYIGSDTNYRCQFCQEVILAIPREFYNKSTDIPYKPAFLKKHKKLLRTLDIPFNWQPH